MYDIFYTTSAVFDKAEINTASMRHPAPVPAYSRTAVPFRPPVYLGDRRYFGKVLETKGFAVGGAWGFGERYLSRGVGALTRAADRLSAGDLKARIGPLPGMEPGT